MKGSTSAFKNRSFDCCGALGAVAIGRDNRAAESPRETGRSREVHLSRKLFSLQFRKTSVGLVEAPLVDIEKAEFDRIVDHFRRAQAALVQARRSSRSRLVTNLS